MWIRFSAASCQRHCPPRLDTSNKAGFASVTEYSLHSVVITVQLRGQRSKRSTFLSLQEQNLVWEFFTKGLFISHLVLTLHFPSHVCHFTHSVFKQKCNCFCLERLGKNIFLQIYMA